MGMPLKGIPPMILLPIGMRSEKQRALRKPHIVKLLVRSQEVSNTLRLRMFTAAPRNLFDDFELVDDRS